MELQTQIAIAGLVFLLASFLQLVRFVRSGRSLMRDLELRHPQQYEALGAPTPGYFESIRRTRYNQFLMGREYQELPDPVLIERCESQRRSELRFLVSSLVVLGIFGLVILYEHLTV